MEIVLRPEPFFSKNLRTLLGCAAAIVLIGMGTADAEPWRDRVLLATYMAMTLLAMFYVIGMRFFKRAALRQRTIVLGEERVLLPAVGWGLRQVEISYAELRSVSTTGQRIFIDIGKYLLALPLWDFAEPADEERFLGGLRERIAALPDGARQWAEIEERQRAAQRFNAVRPIACWAVIALAALMWLMRTVLGAAPIDPGVNLFNLLSGSLLFWSFGSLVERQIGHLRFLLIAVAAGIAGQAASALYAGHASDIHYPMGLGSSVTGALGALAVLNWRFGQRLPGGYRFSAPFWGAALFVTVVLLPLLVSGADNAAHLGGLVSGILFAWILCRDLTEC